MRQRQLHKGLSAPDRPQNVVSDGFRRPPSDPSLGPDGVCAKASQRPGLADDRPPRAAAAGRRTGEVTGHGWARRWRAFIRKPVGQRHSSGQLRRAIRAGHCQDLDRRQGAASASGAYGWCGRPRPTGGGHSPQRTKARHGSATVPKSPQDSSNAGPTYMRQQWEGRYSCRGMQGAFHERRSHLVCCRGLRDRSVRDHCDGHYTRGRAGGGRLTLDSGRRAHPGNAPGPSSSPAITRGRNGSATPSG
jgi:hypothetical protein